MLPKDVQLCPDVATGVDSMGQYQYGDLVQLDQQTVGVIVRLEKEFLHILNMHGKVSWCYILLWNHTQFMLTGCSSPPSVYSRQKGQSFRCGIGFGQQ